MTNNKILIGVTSSSGAGSGKDTFADILIDVTDGRFNKYSFAKPIKDACRAAFGWDDRHLYGNLKEVVDPFWNFSPREAMQKFGTQFGRMQLRDDVWIKAAERFVTTDSFVIIPDVRFDNEAAFILESGGILVDIQRKNHQNIAETAHVSEAGIDEIYRKKAFIVYNDGTLGDLVVEVEKFVVRNHISIIV